MVSKGALSDKEIRSIIKEAEKYRLEHSAPKPIESSGLMAYYDEEEETEKEEKEPQLEEVDAGQQEEEGSKQTSLFEF